MKNFTHLILEPIAKLPTLVKSPFWWQFSLHLLAYPFRYVLACATRTAKLSLKIVTKIIDFPRIRSSAIGSLALLPLTLLGQEPNDPLFKAQNSPSPFYPFTVTGSYIDVSPAHIRTPGFKDKDLSFRQWEAALAYTHPFTACSGLMIGAGWVGNEVNMQDNPEFHETIFNYVNVLVGGYTASFPDWLWKLTLSAFLDTDEFSFVDYALYQGVLWGKYDLCRWIELDFGLIVESGLNKTKVWPIFGFIWIPSAKWQIDIVFPIDISLNYYLTDAWSVAGSVRFLRTRHRLTENEPNAQGIFEYHTTGLELDLTYAPLLWFSLTGFVGSTLKGDLKISDRKDNHATHFKFDGSFYGGISSVLNF